MSFKSINEVHNYLKGAVSETKAGVEVQDEVRVREAMNRLMYEAMFNPNKEISDEIKRLVRQTAKALGIWPASIQGLYTAMGKGQAAGFTVPAINIRGFTFETARAAFRTAIKKNAGAFIFEIAKSEISYTGQRPSEYAANCLAAAIKEGYRGPVFIQGDHFQINAKKFADNRDAEIDGLKKLIKEALDAGFYNIDIDSSTIVDLGKPTVDEEQKPNYETTAALIGFIRENEPKGVTVSIGGEIGEVGGRNSTEEDLRAFMDGLLKTIKNGTQGISKISIQTGTSHGGVVLPDGAIAKLKVDFDTNEKLSKLTRKSYGLAGVVQHGASTLPD
ncbi:MAG: aldolase, partial [Deltaproteobacteria bacterium]